ncbi:hypothetical protein ACTJJ0_32730 [Chitinophaga sp. 22321]|uniref:YD repeat-containing protein n=1 Tax=Chitinophaga hostae TaxID=2831022 RepID=A0ABS5J9B7_9BACT|nr:hypothetical protein [Chitinophaga hostae]MBS0031804.1 hypothetical protein [Chitinophaga hostae]
MKTNIHRIFTLLTTTGFITIYCGVTSPVFAQGIVPGVVAPAETTKRLDARLIIDPVMREFFEAPINTRLIEASISQYIPGSTTPNANYNLSIEVDAAAHTITEISLPVNNPEGGATKKIYSYSEPAKLQSLKYYRGDKNNWNLQQEEIYTYPGMGGNRGLPMRKTRVIVGRDTTVVPVPNGETYVYDSHMQVVEYLGRNESYTCQYNKQHDLSAKKITATAGKWRLLEYVYQYEEGLWIRKEEFETTPDQPRYLKTSTTRKITLQ